MCLFPTVLTQVLTKKLSHECAQRPKLPDNFDVIFLAKAWFGKYLIENF